MYDIPRVEICCAFQEIPHELFYLGLGEDDMAQEIFQLVLDVLHYDVDFGLAVGDCNAGYF